MGLGGGGGRGRDKVWRNKGKPSLMHANDLSIGYTMRMKGYRIYTTEGEARGRVYSMILNPNCITGLYQNAEAFPLPIGLSRAVQSD